MAKSIVTSGAHTLLVDEDGTTWVLVAYTGPGTIAKFKWVRVED